MYKIFGLLFIICSIRIGFKILLIFYLFKLFFNINTHTQRATEKINDGNIFQNSLTLS